MLYQPLDKTYIYDIPFVIYSGIDYNSKLVFLLFYKRIIDKILADSGILVSVHILPWYRARFPYLLLKEYYYEYRKYTHKLEVYIK